MVVGVTAIEAVVGPVFQLYVAAPVAVNVTLVDEPEQIEAVLAVAFTVGEAVTVIVCVPNPVHPELFPAKRI